MNNHKGKTIGYIRVSSGDQNPARQLEGIALAKQKGKYKGRKPVLNAEQLTLIKEKVMAGERKTDIAKYFSISRETLYKYLNSEKIKITSS